MDVAYTAKATTDITCIAETDPEQWTSGDPDLHVRVRGVRDDGDGRDRGRHPALGDPEAARELRGLARPVSAAPTIGISSGFFSPTNFFCTQVASQVRIRLTTM